MTESFCAIVCAYGSYSQFAPLFVASLLTSYPQACVKLYLRNIPDDCQQQLNFVREQISDRFYVHAGWSTNYPVTRELRTLRWFISPDELLPFKYCYWCDIDFVMLPLHADLVGEHVRHMQQLNLPYSNNVRKKPGGELTERLTGLRFIETASYYATVAPKLSTFNMTRALVTNDEAVLYMLMRRAFGEIPIARMNKYPFRPHHGIHLAETRRPRGSYDKQALDVFRNNYFAEHDRLRKLHELLSVNPALNSLFNDMAKVNYQVDGVKQRMRQHIRG